MPLSAKTVNALSLLMRFKGRSVKAVKPIKPKTPTGVCVVGSQFYPAEGVWGVVVRFFFCCYCF